MLDEGDVDCGGLAAKLDVFYLEDCGADFCASREFEVDCECIRLILFCQGGIEVLVGNV
jgi:hypothetical protein